MARRKPTRSRPSRDRAAWTRVLFVVGLMAGGFWLWLEVLSGQPRPAVTVQAPQASPRATQPTSPTPQPPAPPTPAPTTEPASPAPSSSAPRSPIISVRPLEEPKEEPRAAPQQPAQTPPLEPAQPPAPQPEPEPAPAPQPPQLTYVPETDPAPSPNSPMVNPTPNTRVKIPGQRDGLILRRAPASEADKVIALTFDDGPSPVYTPQVLEILARYGAKATFFWLGRELQRRPDLARAVLEAGHAAGNHTWTHRTAKSSDLEAERELEDTQRQLEAVGGAGRLFRPPGGRLNNGLADWALRQGYTVVMWSAQSDDWEPSVSPQQIVENVLGAARPGSIVLLHDGGGDRSRTVAALPAVLEGLQAQGYRLVTVPEMLAAMPVQQ